MTPVPKPSPFSMLLVCSLHLVFVQVVVVNYCRKQGFDKVLHGRTIDQITEKSNCFIVLSEIANLLSFFEITMIF